jgi:hypothetical protein
MTDLLLKPEDTGDIPAVETVRRRIDPGMTTQNMAPWVAGLAPALRRPTAVLRLVEASQPEPPRPLPAPTAPTGELIWDYAPEPPYQGRHRRPSRWDWLTVPLAMAWQRIGRSL